MTVTSTDGKIITQYMHLSRTIASDGQYVGAGTIIAAMGNTGNVSGSIGPDKGAHLHFGVKIKEGKGNHEFVDPLLFLGT